MKWVEGMDHFQQVKILQPDNGRRGILFGQDLSQFGEHPLAAQALKEIHPNGVADQVQQHAQELAAVERDADGRDPDRTAATQADRRGAGCRPRTGSGLAPSR